MCLFRYEDDPEPEERAPAGILYVPVRPGSGAGAVIRLFRTALGARTAVGFTSTGRLAATLGEGQGWIRLSEWVLRELCEPLGASLITVDPTLSAASATPAPAPAAAAAPLQPGRLPVQAV
ncbi:SAV_915 family protein [Streptomyces katrae]|uniref:SAV_915 family protein n=1 Tax=Streptomyces katrae TaxID=68223 RepID=UPI0004C0B261|nr:SAV_915 family protein [Streptomyces katrae]